jgi:hypothetical protein
LLVTLHPAIQVCERLPWYYVLLETGLHLRDHSRQQHAELRCAETFLGNSRQGRTSSIYPIALNTPF